MEVIYTQGGILNPSLLQSNKDTRNHRMGMESGNHVTIFIPLILMTIYTVNVAASLLILQLFII